VSGSAKATTTNGFQFEAIEHGGEYPDTMPQGVLVTNAKGHACIYDVSPTDRTLRPGKRPQDPTMDGAGLTFTAEGGKERGRMPEAVRVTDAEGRTSLYVPQKPRQR